MLWGVNVDREELADVIRRPRRAQAAAERARLEKLFLSLA